MPCQFDNREVLSKRAVKTLGQIRLQFDQSARSSKNTPWEWLGQSMLSIHHLDSMSGGWLWRVDGKEDAGKHDSVPLVSLADPRRTEEDVAESVLIADFLMQINYLTDNQAIKLSTLYVAIVAILRKR